jgi:beta-galactosidase
MRVVVFEAVLAACWCFVTALPLGAQSPSPARWFDAERPTATYQDLGGSWQACPLVGAKSFTWPLPVAGWQSVQLPNPDPFQGLTPAADFHWFAREFTLSDALRAYVQRGGRLILHFGGVSYRWVARVNGRQIIDSYDGFTPREIDVTDLLKLDGSNQLALGTANRNGLLRSDATDAEWRSKEALHSLIAPASLIGSQGTANSMIGVWGEIELWARPVRRIENIFVRPNFRKQRVDLDVEMTGAGAASLRVRILNAAGQPVLCFTGVPSKPLDSGVTTVTVGSAWAHPRLWEPEDPYLYTAEVTRLDARGAVLDVQRATFGFREIWISGENLMMNGHRLFLARKSLLPFSEKERESQLDTLIVAKANSARLHLGGCYRPGTFASYADTKGLMLVPEAPFVNPTTYHLDDPLFWENYRALLQRWVRSARNHPSIVMWSLSNEILWCGAAGQNKDCAQLMYDAGLGVKQVDPTRPIQHDGDWDLPPLHKLETANLHYPWEPSAHWYPTECWVFEHPDPKAPPHISGLDGYPWPRGTKPLIVGEFSWNWNGYTDAPVAMTMYMGDKAYDWDAWSSWATWRQLIRWQCDAWRVARYAGINPWYHMPETWGELMPLETVVLREHARAFFSAEKFPFHAYLLNDTQRNRQYTVRWQLLRGQTSLFTRRQQFTVQAGAMQPFTLWVAMPTVTAPADDTLELSVSREGKVVNMERYPIRVRPRALLTWPAGAVLYDPAGASSALFTRLGLTPVRMTSLLALTAKAVVVGQGSLAHLPIAERDTLRRFVQQGGTVLTLGESSWPGESFGLPMRMPLSSQANRAWVRAAGHPALQGITDADLAWWRADDWVASQALEKPLEANGCSWRTLIDVGSNNGLKNAVLLEVFAGKGRYLLNQLMLERATVDPGARAVLAGLLNNLTEPMPAHGDVMVLAAATSTLAGLLATQGIATQPWTTARTDLPVFIDAGYAGADPAAIATWVRNGGQALLTNVTPDTVARWSAVVEGGLSLAPCDPPEGCRIVKTDPAVWGISNEELFWARGGWNESHRRTATSPDDHDTVHRTARIAQYAVKTKAPGTALLAPAALVRVPQGQGNWLVSTLDFAAGLGAEGVKTYRLTEALFTNLGGRADPHRFASYGNFQPISLAFCVNRGFQDDAAGNGKGGWTDQGEADLRYFPVNLSGFDMKGLPFPAPEHFPAKLTLLGTEFTILDPREHGGKSCLVLEPDYAQLPQVARGDYLPAVLGLPVGRKFARLYSLHAAAWAQAPEGTVLWSYRLHYVDGATADLPIRNGKETADWYRPQELPVGHVAWIGESNALSPIGLYSAPLDNPYPEKEVVSLDIISGKAAAIPGIIALTTADRQDMRH